MTWLFSKALMQDYENSPYSQEQVAAYSADNCSDGKQYAQLNVMPTPQLFWRNDKTMDVSSLSRFGVTCAVLTVEHGADLLTWFRAGFHAKTSAQQVAAQASTAHGQDCGVKWHELSARYDRDTSTWKTHQCLFIEDLPASSLTLPKWGMTRNGVLFQHKTLARPINVTEFGYAPPTPNNKSFYHTPTTGGLNGGSNSRRALKQRQALWPSPRAGDGNRNGSKPQEHWNRSFSANWLRDAVQLYPTPVCVDSGAFFNTSGGKPRPTLGAMAKHNLWPTPTVCGNNNRKGLSAKSGDGLGTAVKNWPTPQASDVRDRGNLSSGSVQRRLEKGKQINLSMSVSHDSGQLNPTWVEWLMGWPLGWTDLKPLATVKFRVWQRQHFLF